MALPAEYFDLPELEDLEAELAERSLADFIRLGWRDIDPAPFIDNWHIHAIAEHLEAVNNGECHNLIINMPPRHMKSLSVSVAWQPWTWLQRKRSPLTGPGVAFLTLSYAQSLSIRDSVKSRRLINSRWYQRHWGDRYRLANDQNAKGRFENSAAGYRLAASVDGTATGEGGDIIIIDDAINAKDALSPTVRQNTNDWFDNTMSSRLNNPKTGAFVLIMQRLHENDLIGHVLKRDPGQWTHLCLPARYEADHPFVSMADIRTENGELLWPERMGETEVQKLEKSMGSYGAAGQLQQRPAPREGGVLKPEWFRPTRKIPHDAYRSIRAWDLAATEQTPGTDPDWTAGVIMYVTRSGRFIIAGITRFRGSPMATKRRLKLQAVTDGRNTHIRIPQDPGQAGKSQAQDMVRYLRGFPVAVLKPTGDKATRATPLAAAAEAGDVFLYESGDPEKDAWIQPFIDEISVFPFGKHDDQVDAAADAYNELTGGKVTLFDTE